ncbi:MAG: methyltransferase domain-containing protein [Gammaproteobacteria bacterium]|nr:methyltransferase domain-containing protein [Gammaproteobacteria bacterium]
MSNNSILDLYTELANNPDKDFGWETGLQNARNHGYKEAWIAAIPEEIWNYSAAVGNPFSAGELCEGDSVLDIGCGAGVDICVASLLVGDTGSVYGIDITPAMVEKSKRNAAIAGLSNITVYEGSFDRLPVDDGAVNIVISNGAINLAASKEVVFSEIYRVLIKGGNLYFSDMIKDESNLDESGCNEGSWADCVAGTLRSGEIVQLLEKAGFVDVSLLYTNHYKTSASTVGATFSAKKA